MIHHLPNENLIGKEEAKSNSQLLMLKASNSTEQLLFVYEFDNHYKSLVKDEEYLQQEVLTGFQIAEAETSKELGKMSFQMLAKREFQDCIDVMRPQKLTLRSYAKTVFGMG